MTTLNKIQENKIRGEFRDKFNVGTNQGLRVAMTSGAIHDFELRKIENFWLTKMKELEIPLGISQWKDYGIKYGYWQYFEDKMKEQMEIAVGEREEEIIRLFRERQNGWADETSVHPCFDEIDYLIRLLSINNK